MWSWDWEQMMILLWILDSYLIYQAEVGQVFKFPVAVDAVTNEAALVKVTLLFRCLERCRSFVIAILILLTMLCLRKDEPYVVRMANLSFIVFLSRLNNLVFLKGCRNFQIFGTELLEAVCQTRNILTWIKNCGQKKHVLALNYLDWAFEVFVAGWFHWDDFPDSFHNGRWGANISLLDMIGLEVCIKAAKGQLFLQVSIESERVLLSHQNADFFIFGAKVPQNAFSHSFKSALNQAIGDYYAINKGLKASRNVQIA